MLSNRSYLARAFYEWIVDSECTPILLLDANHPGCVAPMEYAEDGELVFNISPNAVRDLHITNQAIHFKASFSGVVNHISAPMQALLAIYAEENGEGIFFDSNEADDGTEQDSYQLPSHVRNSGAAKPHLAALTSYVKEPSSADSDASQDASTAQDSTTSSKKPFLTLVD